MTARKARHRAAMQLVLELEKIITLPEETRQSIVAAVDQQRPKTRRLFVQHDCEYSLWLQDIISDHTSRPLLAHRIMAHLFAAVPWDSQVARITRAELAERCRTKPSHVSTTLIELEKWNVLKREPIEGTRSYRIVVNPRLATRLPEGPREEAQAAALPLIDPNAPEPTSPPRGRPQLSVIQ